MCFTLESKGDGENRTLLEDMKPESDRLAAAAAAEEEEGKAKASPVESPPPLIGCVSESRGELGLVGVPPSLLPPLDPPPQPPPPLPQLRPPPPPRP